MRRGDVVVAVLPGDTGKPRPAVVVQADLLNERAPTGYLLCPLTTTLSGLPYRPTLEPRASNGIRLVSEAMTDRLSRVSAQRLGEAVGRLDVDQLTA